MSIKLAGDKSNFSGIIGRMKKGTLVVIDGGDGAGKQTQTQMLVERLAQEGYESETLDFPQYKNNLFGKLLRECLDGNRGDFLQVDPRIASTLYAADRFEAKPTIETWLAEGKVVVLDRYVSSNMLHQGSKIEDEETLTDFLQWLDQMEHGVFGLPRPEVILYFNVDPNQRVKLLEQASGKSENVMDIAETNLEHQKETDAAAKRIIEKLNNWKQVDCMDGENMRSREDIHEEVYAIVKEIL